MSWSLTSAAVNASDAARVNIGYGTGNNSALEIPQKYQFVCTAVNNNIVRISGGALGFPVL